MRCRDRRRRTLDPQGASFPSGVRKRRRSSRETLRPNVAPFSAGDPGLWVTGRDGYNEISLGERLTRTMSRPYAMTWNLTEVHGWGLLGTHTAMYLLDIGRPPLLVEKPLFDTMRASSRERLAGLQGGYENFQRLRRENAGKVLALSEFDVMHGLANGFVPGPGSTGLRGARNLGVIAYEDTRLTSDVVARARSYDAVIVHSEFNRRLLADQGVARVRVALQGIDPSEIHPPTGPVERRFGDRFVVFSGGKLEFRKAQDVVLEGFRIFQRRHPEALLVTAWRNVWPETAMSAAESPWAKTQPRIVPGTGPNITEWAVANGVPADAFLDLGFLRRDQIAPVLWNCDAAVFPNRCEGATNLVAMEAMACGVPTVLSANTGHLDILRADCVYSLNRQTPVPDRDGSRIEWGESDPEELAQRLEEIHSDRVEARARAARAARFMLTARTWRRFAENFINVCDLS